MNGSIVCGADGSAVSDAALAVAATLARRLDLPFVVAHAARLPARLVPPAATARW